MPHPSPPGTLVRSVLRGLAGASIVLACTAALAAPRSAPAAVSASSPPPLVVAPVHIHGMSYDRGRHSLVLTITGPVTISTRSLKSPPRLVVDIPAASLDSANRELVIKDGLVERVRVSQFKIFPPTVRVVIETATAEEPLIAVQQTGKRLYVTLAPARPNEEPTPEGVLPSPGPEPSAFTPPTLPETTPREVPSPAWTPAPPTPAPTSRPSPAPTARAWPRPTPTATPGGIRTRLRPGMPIPTPRGRRVPPSAMPAPGTEWRDLFPVPSSSPGARPSVAPTPTPAPYWRPTPPAFEPTPIPPPQETGNETLPSVP